MNTPRRLTKIVVVSLLPPSENTSRDLQDAGKHMGCASKLTSSTPAVGLHVIYSNII